MAVGLTISIIQAATQINEATLTFVPKLLVVALVLVLLGPVDDQPADRIHPLRLPGRVAGRPMTVQLSGGQAALLFLVMMRCTGLVFAAPLFGHHAIPTLVKFGLAACLTIALANPAGATAGTLPLLIAAPIELVIGLSLGFILSLASRPWSWPGGSSRSSSAFRWPRCSAPRRTTRATAIDPFFSVLAGLLFLAMGLHLAIVQVAGQLVHGYPVGSAAGPPTWP